MHINTEHRQSLHFGTWWYVRTSSGTQTYTTAAVIPTMGCPHIARKITHPLGQISDPVFFSNKGGRRQQERRLWKYLAAMFPYTGAPHGASTFLPVEKISVEELNPFRTTVPYWGQTPQISSSLSPKRDCGSIWVN